MLNLLIFLFVFGNIGSAKPSICLKPPNSPTTDCKQSTTRGKPPGLCDILFNHGAHDGMIPYAYINNSNTETCYEACNNDTQCQMAVFNQYKRQCKLYEVFKIVSEPGSYVFKWEFCNFTTGFSVKDRCQGQWIFKASHSYCSYYYKGYENNIKVSNVVECQKRCHVNPVCGAFNFNTSNQVCHIIKNFLPSRLQKNKEDHFNFAYFWYCADVQNYHLDSTCVVSNKECRGSFRVDGMGLDPSYMQVLLDYPTHNFSDCLVNCKGMSLCRSLLYSSNYSRCLLMSQDAKICSWPLSHNHSKFKTYVRVTWHCCMTSRLQISAPFFVSQSAVSNVKKQQSGEWPCGCLTNTNVFVKRFDCNVDSGVERFMNNQTCKNARIECSVGQCFRILKSWDTLSYVDSSLSNLLTIRWWFYLVYTGYENFVIRSPNASFVLKTTQPSLCQFYDASIPSKKLEIVSRSEWCASNRANTKYNTIPLTLPVPEVVIGNLTEKLCFCRSRESCANLLVDAQQRHFDDFNNDFPFNFVIGATGHVFEGLGWLRMWQKPYEKQQPPHLLVVFAGNFTNGRPLKDAIVAGKRLIYTGVSMGYIAENYTMRLEGSHKDVNNTLYTVVGLWPHYQGRTPLPCTIFHHVTVLVNLLVVLLIVVLLITVVRRFFYPSHSRHCAVLLTDLQHCGGESSVHVHNVAVRKHNISKGLLEEEPLCSLPLDLQMPLHQRFHVQYTSCFWLSPPLSQRSQHRSCRCALSLLLQQHQDTATPLKPVIHIPSLAPLGSSCSWASLVLFCSSFSILRPSVLVIAHLPNTDPSWLQHILRSLVANFQAKRCLCKTPLQSLKLHKIETMPQQSSFVKVDSQKIVSDPIELHSFWINFNGLPYLHECH